MLMLFKTIEYYLKIFFIYQLKKNNTYFYLDMPYLGLCELFINLFLVNKLFKKKKQSIVTLLL